ncbi:hypothetical protein PENTCL1PPCAC_14462 [Pristionchus entomophagus]|uniref:Uncharacterized protein n=1 Tax=Pristionchus entomophagus TaxID=358040 RepID=A0AAV5TBI4_9BILA|nr:hypothetical protein PENTCL1PPCAC_14462 [Pristionchus entomophagus]
MSSRSGMNAHWRDAGEKGITLPSDVILSFSFDNADFPLYTKLLLAHDPFGCCVTPRASSVRGFDVVMEKDGLQSFTSEKADLAHRGTLEFLLDYDSVGIPRWIIDGLRPMITVSVVLQRADGSTDGPKVSAKIGVCRLDGMSQVGTFKSKENIYMNTLVVDNGYSDSRFEVEFEPSTTLHDHPEFGGSDGIRISLSTRDKVRVSHVHLQFTLPDEMPAEFSDWLTESRQLREFRSLHEARPCIDIGLFGL